MKESWRNLFSVSKAFSISGAGESAGGSSALAAGG